MQAKAKSSSYLPTRVFNQGFIEGLKLLPVLGSNCQKHSWEIESAVVGHVVVSGRALVFFDHLYIVVN